MNFGEKLLQLRKEFGMSQENLAEKLNTSRQAVSKWENSQGYPETEKLLMIGTIFNVSMDYLLKDNITPTMSTDSSFYVSKEMAESFLIHSRKSTKYSALGISFMLSSILPYLLLKDIFNYYFIMIALLIAIGIGFLISAEFMDEAYKKLKQTPLMLDEKVLKELRLVYLNRRKFYLPLLISNISLIFVGATILLLFEKGFVNVTNKTPFYVLSATIMIIGFYFIIYISSMMESYELLLKNEDHTNRFSYKLIKKCREKYNQW